MIFVQSPWRRKPEKRFKKLKSLNDFLIIFDSLVKGTTNKNSFKKKLVTTGKGIARKQEILTIVA